MVINDLLLCVFIYELLFSGFALLKNMFIMSDFCECSACWKLFRRTPQKETLRASSQPSTITAGTKNGPWTWAMKRVATCFPFPRLLLWSLTHFCFYYALFCSWVNGFRAAHSRLFWMRSDGSLLSTGSICSLHGCTLTHNVQPMHPTQYTAVHQCIMGLTEDEFISEVFPEWSVLYNIQSDPILVVDSWQTLVENVYNLNLRGTDLIYPINIEQKHCKTKIKNTILT